jgi:hypothetical protein
MSHGSALERFKSIPEWAWFVAVGGLAILLGAAIASGSDGNLSYSPLLRGFVMAAVIAYLYPGWRLSLYVEKRLGRYVGIAVLFLWFLVLVPAGQAADRYGL